MINITLEGGIWNCCFVHSIGFAVVNLKMFLQKSHQCAVIEGYYNDKIKMQNSIIKDTTNGAYFDSNLYPILIGWLPLKDGYKQDISIYNYNPSEKSGVMSASVNNVESGNYLSKNSGSREVWIVSVSDEMEVGEPATALIILIKKTGNCGSRK